MDTATVRLHGGPLDGTIRQAPIGPDGQPVERTEFDHTTDGGQWYVEYQRTRKDADGWHFAATGVEQRADEE